MAPTTRAKFRSLNYKQQIEYLNKIKANSEGESDDSDVDEIISKKSNSVLCKSKKRNQKVAEYSDVEDVYNDDNVEVEWNDCDSSDDDLDSDEECEDSDSEMINDETCDNDIM